MRTVTLTLLITSAFFAAPVLACEDHPPGTEPAKQSISRPTSWISGEVREVDLDDGTLALSHSKIAAWGMKPMDSMVFKAADASQMARLKAGDKVTFRAGMLGQQPTITQIKLATN